MVVIYSRDMNGRQTAARITKEIIEEFIKNGRVEGEANDPINIALMQQTALMDKKDLYGFNIEYKVKEIYNALLRYVGRKPEEAL